jgi:hypothetical protein
MTVAESLALALRYGQEEVDAEDDEREMEERCSLCGLPAQRIAGLGGEQPMSLPRMERWTIGLARWLLRPPELLVIDRLFAGLTRREAEHLVATQAIYHRRHPFRCGACSSISTATNCRNCPECRSVTHLRGGFMSLLTQYDADARAVRRMTRRFLLVAALAYHCPGRRDLRRQGLLRQTVSYSFVADSAQDIAKGQAVRIAGFRVGSVTEVSLRDDGSVAVGMEVDADQARFVTHDARIELRKEGLVGSPTLEIVPGPDKTRLAAAQARLAFSRADGLGALANQVRDEFVPILKDIKAITGAGRSAEGPARHPGADPLPVRRRSMSCWPTATVRLMALAAPRFASWSRPKRT